MKPTRVFLALFILFTGFTTLAADRAEEKSPKDALKAFNDLVGPWRGTGEPEGSRAEKQRGFWVEGIDWTWQFKGNDVWLRAAIDKGKYFKSAELRYLPAKNLYQLTLLAPGGRDGTKDDRLVFAGPLTGKRLVLERTDAGTKETQRLVFSFLHSNRYLYTYEIKKPGRASFARLYRVGVTRKDVPFAGKGDGSPECVVSGGKGTIPVSYKGKTYYVCCSGCRDEFNENPVKYIKEFEARLAKEKAGK
jgi:YHS domain-containing protein